MVQIDQAAPIFLVKIAGFPALYELLKVSVTAPKSAGRCG